MTVKTIRKEHYTYHRNPNTAEISHRAGLVERYGSQGRIGSTGGATRYGSGIERMINVLSAMSLPSPEIASTPLVFTFLLRKDPITREYLQEFGLNERQIAAVSFLRVHGTITSSQYQEFNAVAARPAVNDLTLSTILARVSSSHSPGRLRARI
ncbi:hypothetical protein [Methanoculleus sp. UBA291]|uniref:hypothetical protein n=1 Tax=Methanoculleus sp. UBA291 TaxID=1915495 RepID=UPI00316ADC91